MYEIDASSPMPIYAQLERSIRLAIVTGRLREGDRLPTVRQMAVDLRINANTVARVYGELERTNVLETRRGVGTFVSLGAMDRAKLEVRGESGEERAKRLESLCERFLTEATALGFASEDAIDGLRRVLARKSV